MELRLMRTRLYILLAILSVAAGAGAAAGNAGGISPVSIAAAPDSIPVDESELGNDTIGKTHANLATGIDGMKELLEGRYLNKGESFTKKWYDHLFLQTGIGAEMMVPPGDNYRFDPLTTVHVGVGKQLNKLNAVRLTFVGGLGYQKEVDRMLYKVGGRIDHLFDVSSYFSGYNPSRLLGVSTVVGFGAQYAKMNRLQRSGSSYEMHLGLQMRFFTGPQGYINIEPYYGVATDMFDLSVVENWRKIDMFYGANVNIVYYLHDNLSRESRARLYGRGTDWNVMPEDSTLSSWQQPWFLEFASGLNFVDSETMGLSGTLGQQMSISGGKWLSPVIGLRLSAFLSTARYSKYVTPVSESPYNPSYIRNFNSFYFGGRAEALINPFGFSPNYDWDSRFGVYALGGIGMGRVMKYTPGRHLACRTVTYTAGLHLWTRLASGLQLFLEPRYTQYVYKVPYSNVAWDHRFSDMGLSVDMGFTVTTRGMRFRKRAADDGAADETSGRCVVAGVGGGLNFMSAKSSYDSGESGFPYNGIAFGEYHFNSLSAVRLSFEFVSRSAAGMTSYTDYNMANEAAGYSPVVRHGLWNHRYYMGIVSLGYMANLTNLFAGCRANRLFEMEAFVGPACTILFGESASIYSNERLLENHEVRRNDAGKAGSANIGFNGGLKVVANVHPRLAVVFMPTVYMLGGVKLDGMDMLKIKTLETLNLGVQYKF